MPLEELSPLIWKHALCADGFSVNYSDIRYWTLSFCLSYKWFILVKCGQTYLVWFDKDEHSKGPYKDYLLIGYDLNVCLKLLDAKFSRAQFFSKIKIVEQK